MRVACLLSLMVALAAAAPSVEPGVSLASANRAIRDVIARYAGGDSKVVRSVDSNEHLADSPASAGDQLSAQDCVLDHRIRITSIEEFIGWDMQLSQVFRGPIEIEIENGRSVTDTITITAGLSSEKSFIASSLSAEFGVSFSKAWTTDSRQHGTVFIPAGSHGAIVTSPVTTRRFGIVMKGCQGRAVQVAKFMADSFKEHVLNGITFIQGEISLCSRPVSEPMRRCEGEGTLNSIGPTELHVEGGPKEVSP
ncbi:hypothetical protein BN1723_002771 [Verticillium longisporum]|uniref:Uncharacterized protein n=1 Tax=Verticillium longisporum TaxID=100787 RepID=A0A0G4LIX6_VERLO|nr:hypothetical protein HYQ44_010736 [Verticillium longisporum]KAG7145470.1 hypothetical protein HYQ46_005786 [Verticillium longisporum]CRK21655.1 hypothetical protein BN1723_002771 [Verticillium longisporum]CRK29975.1 hypothetical protein BN1708_005112 [Verticillium longisporum]